MEAVTDEPFHNVFFVTRDGLRLHARDYSSSSARLPVVCLPGLTRNARDFESLAPWLAEKRRVICCDFRGRGLSDYAADPTSYRVDVERDDTLGFLDALGIERFAVIGTSRGGLVGMLLAALAPQRLAGLFLNDIGPMLEPEGLIRIRNYIGVAAPASDWSSIAITMAANNPSFKGLTLDDWLVIAHRIYRDEGGIPVLDYDLKLAVTFPTLDEIKTQQLPNLWSLYDALLEIPIHFTRGENSDLLSAATAQAMIERRISTRLTTIPDRGHAPFLDETPSRLALEKWLEAVDLTG